MTFDFEGRKPDYTSPDGAIAFFANQNYGTDAYDVVINNDFHFLHSSQSPS